MRGMAIGIPVWQGRVAPTFDVAEAIVIVCSGAESLHPVAFPPGTVMERIQWLKEHAVEEVLCGAISRGVESLLVQQGIHVRGFLAGDVQTIQRARFTGTLTRQCFCMPGCQGRRCRCRVHGGGHGGQS